MATYQVREDENGQKILSDPLSGLSGALATSETPGAVQPDNVTIKVDSAGVLSAIGGNLLANSEEWITESGTFVAPVDGWYDVLAIDGGNGAIAEPSGKRVYGGSSGAYKHGFVYLNSGQEIPITIGSGGVGGNNLTYVGGTTVVGDLDFSFYDENYFFGEFLYVSSSLNFGWAIGAGFGGGLPGADNTVESYSGRWFGAGGCGFVDIPKSGGYGISGNGKQGVVRFRWHDPAKAAGLPE